MRFPRSIKSKLILLLIVTGMLPLLIAMGYTLYNTVNSAFESAEHELKVTNELIEKEVNAMMASNFHGVAAYGSKSRCTRIFDGDARKSQPQHERAG